jgi:hypothetical protein
MGFVRKEVNEKSDTILSKVTEERDERSGLSRSTVREVFKGM